MTGIQLQPVIILYDDGTRLTSIKIEEIKNTCKSNKILLLFFDGIQVQPFESQLFRGH